MSIADKLEEIAGKLHQSKDCAYKVLYERLPKQDQEALDNAWAKGYSINTILNAIRSEGHKSSNETLRAHKNRTCRCATQ
jgi:hypothetical protein